MLEVEKRFGEYFGFYAIRFDFINWFYTATSNYI